MPEDQSTGTRLMHSRSPESKEYTFVLCPYGSNTSLAHLIFGTCSPSVRDQTKDSPTTRVAVTRESVQSGLVSGRRLLKVTLGHRRTLGRTNYFTESCREVPRFPLEGKRSSTKGIMDFLREDRVFVVVHEPRLASFVRHSLYLCASLLLSPHEYRRLSCGPGVS